MTAFMQELSVRLSLFTRSLHLSTLRRESSKPLCGRHRSLRIRTCSSSSSSSAAAASSSSSSVPIRNSYFPIRRFGGLSAHRHRSDDFRQGALERSDRVELSAKTDDLGFAAGLKFSDDDDDDVDSPTEDLVSDADFEETEEDRDVAKGIAQFGDSGGYVKFVQKEGSSTKEVQAPNYLTMTDKQLFAQCRMDTYRASGPGGQHRNKTDSAVRLTHIPTGLVSQAADDRSQHINRSLALSRLRQIIALEVRDPVELERYNPPLELLRILPSGTGGKRGNSQRIGPNHPDFILGMKALMDLLYATGGSVSDAGKVLGITTGALSKLITSNNLLWQGMNKLRSSKGLKPLR